LHPQREGALGEGREGLRRHLRLKAGGHTTTRQRREPAHHIAPRRTGPLTGGPSTHPSNEETTLKKLLTGIALCVATLAASAQTWPEKPVTLVVPFPPGGSTDQVARAVMPRLTEKFKQSFLVENKPGATGTIGATHVKRAAPDGYTFLVTSLGPLVI